MSRRTIRSILALVLGPGLGAVRALPPAGGIVPGPGCPPARTEQVRGRSALALECPFEARPLERAFWDLPVRWDLRTAAGVRLELLCADTSPISQCNLYLRARGVWHAAALPVAGTGLWRTLRVLKTDFAPEGVSRGWGEVDRVRLAAWRGAGRDTVLHLGAVEILPGAAPLTLVRGSVSVPAAERGAAARYAREVMDAFVAVGVVPCCVDDVDLSEACLDPAHVTVLPYHPAMPDGAARALARTVERGGSVLGFYNLPGPLAEATGLRTGAYVRSTEVAAGIEGIVFQPGIVSGLPPALRQHSPNFLDIVPTGDRVRALGWWYDSRGGTTPHCAAALSPRGAWFGHVYLGQDSLAGPRLLLAVAGHFRPELWRLAVRGRIEAIPEGVASTDLPTTLAALEAYCRGNPRSRAALAHCARYHETARRLQASEQYAAALDFAEKSRAALLEAVIGLHRAPAGEFRGIWCHRGYGIEGWDWSRCAALLSGSGITAVFPNVANAAVADYASQVLQPSAVFRERGDQVAACLDACTPRGIEVHAWKICLHLGDRPDAALRESLLRAGRLQQDRDGGTRNWLCPSHPENRRAEVRAVEELVTRYPGLAGVHLDFIRFPGSGSCTCPSCRRAFEAQLGIRLTQWPREVAGEGPLAESWRQFRRDTITSLVAEMATALRRARPGARLSAAVFSNWASCRDTVGQDWVAWARSGSVDFLCPMNYHDEAGAQRDDVRRQMACLRGLPTALYPGIGMSTGDLDALGVLRQVNTARAAGARGFVLFELNRREAVEVLPRLAAALRPGSGAGAGDPVPAIP